MISKESLEKFKVIYQEQFKATLTYEEATQMATDLINLMKVLLKPEPTRKEEQVEERSQDETGRILNY